MKNPQNVGIGIDLGIKDLAICSDENVYKNINKDRKVLKLERHKRRLQRMVARKYKKNKIGGKYCKTCNIIKAEKTLLRATRRLTNIRKNNIHQTTTEIIKREPSFICVEDLNVRGMVHNHKLARSIQLQCFREFRRQIEYKSLWNNIKLVVADRFFPSSKTCSECGYVNKELKLSDRKYRCPQCGIVIDRDYNASLNLKHYGEIALTEM